MNTNNPGWKRLIEIPSKTFSLSDLSPEHKVKIKDTVLYSLSQNPDQVKAECVIKCTIAVMAEYHVAHWMAGYVNRGIEELDDPYTYAYDVLSHPKYSGLRIEVKTHQSDSRWIGVTTGQFGTYPKGTGINLGPFLTFPVSDLIIIFKSSEVSLGIYELTPTLAADKEAFYPSNGLVVKSNFTGWYLSGRVNHDADVAFKILK